MIALQIKEIKNFMGKLLGSDCFDSFLLEEASITTYNTFHIDGHVNQDFYTPEEWNDPSVHPYDFSSWKTIRPFCFELIKGKKTPAAFKFVFHLTPKAATALLSSGSCDVPAEQVKALVLNCKYDSSGLVLITGTAFHTFIMDKSVDRLWDRSVKTFLDRKGIRYEEI